MTAEKFEALKTKLERLKKVTRPKAIKETKQYAENGDFSENAEYQIAKSRLRGINRAIDETEQQINHAVLIETPSDATVIHIGHTVTISTGGKETTFTILGPTETNPGRGIISYKSPIGAALLGRRIGEIIKIGAAATAVEYTIVSIR